MRRYRCEPAVDASRLVLKVGYAAPAESGRHVLVSYIVRIFLLPLEPSLCGPNTGFCHVDLLLCAGRRFIGCIIIVHMTRKG